MDLKYRHTIFAVVRQQGSQLTAWEMEMRGNNLYHPAYGVIPKSDALDMDMFITSKEHKTPSFNITVGERGFYFAGDNLQSIIWLPV